MSPAEGPGGAESLSLWLMRPSHEPRRLTSLRLPPDQLLPGGSPTGTQIMPCWAAIRGPLRPLPYGRGSTDRRSRPSSSRDLLEVSDINVSDIDALEIERGPRPLKSALLGVAIDFMDGKKVDLNLLVALDALLAERNVTRAARRLGLSQPALSAQLARLRDLLDDPLFLPAQRGVTLTARAIELEVPVRQALDQARNALAQGRGFDPATADLTVAIACSDYVQVAVIAQLVLDLRVSAPKLRIAIRQLDASLLSQQMEAGVVDLAVMTPSTAPPSLRTRPLFHERYVTIAGLRHPWVKGN